MKIRLRKRTDARSAAETKAEETKVVTTNLAEANATGKYDAVWPGSNLTAGHLALVEPDDRQVTVDSTGSIPIRSTPIRSTPIHATPIHAKYHSVLAMEAARKMRRTRQKLKTGQQVCHHLKMMLAIEPFPQSSLSCGQAGAATSQFRLGF